MAAELELDEPRFSQTFELPADPSSNRDAPLKITYADYGYRNEQYPEEEHVLFFFGSMTASRWLNVGKDALAKKHKVRIIEMDRPGFGGSDEVPVAQRIVICRASTFALLHHLGIRHVTLGAHSGGTVYALDFALHHSELLDPDRPYIAIGGPWVLPSHSGAVQMTIVNMLPASFMGATDLLAKTIVNVVGPVLGSSFGISGLLIKPLITPFMSEPKPDENVTEIDREHARAESNALFSGTDDRVFGANIRGLNDEALLLIQKGEAAGGWADWGDFDTLIPRLVENLRSASRRLKVDVFYAESDSLIGDDKPGARGPAWLDACWQPATADRTVEYSRRTVKGANHDNVWALKWGTSRRVFEYMSGISKAAAMETPAAPGTAAPE